MKKALFVLLCMLAALVLSGCRAAAPDGTETGAGQTVVFVNGVTAADVWILPDTARNRGTTVWGRASASGVQTEESRAVPLPQPGENGLYLLRMIDANKFFYSVNEVALLPGCRLLIRETAPMGALLEVYGANGELQNAYPVFCARL